MDLSKEEVAKAMMAERYRLLSRTMMVVNRETVTVGQDVRMVEAQHHTTLQVLCRRLKSAAVAFQELNICYRIGKRPSEALFTRLDKAKATLALMSIEGENDDTIER